MLAAEAAALSEAQDQLEYARVLFMQMLGKVDSFEEIGKKL